MKRYCIIVALSIILLPSLSLAYDAHLAHPLLAEQGYRQWRQLGPWAELTEARSLLKRGASDEDFPATRCLNHFYNPTNNQGLSVWGRQLGVSAITWSHLADYQNKLWGGDFSWPRALQQAQDSDLDSAWLALGHNLHLLADMASPAHVHNDQHLEGDNYEAWVKADLSSDSDLSWAVNLDFPVSCDAVTTCLQDLAEYTAQRALSRDWSAIANLPADAELDRLGQVWTNQGLIAKYDELTDSLILDSEVHEAYWHDLAPRVVAYEARLIDVFWREADIKWTKQEVLVPDAPEQVKVRALPEPIVSLPQPSPQSTRPIKAPVLAKPPLVVPVATQTTEVTPWSEIINDPNLWFWPIVNESLDIPQQYLRVELPVYAGASNPVLTEMPSSDSDDDQSEELPDDSAPDDDTPDDGAPDDEVPDDVPDDTPDDNSGDDSGAGSGSGASSDPDPVPVTPSLSFTNLSSSYHNNLHLTWAVEPAGTWSFDLSYQLDDGLWHSALDDSSDHSWSYLASTFHNKIKLQLMATSSSGLSTSTEALLNFEPQWPANLLAYWPADDCAGGVISEVVAGNHLTQNATWTSGRFGCALEQDGLDNQVLGRWLLQPISASNLTIAFFWRNEAGQEAGLNANALILADSNQRWLAGIRPGVYNSTYWTAGEEIILDYQMPSDHQWHHVAVTFDTTGMKFYLDGAMVLERPGDASLTADIAKFYLRGNASIAEFDDLSWWRGVLSPAQINDLAQGGRLWQ